MYFSYGSLIKISVSSQLNTLYLADFNETIFKILLYFHVIRINNTVTVLIYNKRNTLIYLSQLFLLSIVKIEPDNILK